MLLLVAVWLTPLRGDAWAASPPPSRPREAPTTTTLEKPADLRVEPSAATFAPGAALGYETTTIRLRNGAAHLREIDSIRVSGGDWMGFEIAQDVLPDRIQRGADVTLRLRARPNHFVDDTGDRFAAENYRPLRAGHATLDVVVDGKLLRVPLHFEPAPRRGLSLAALVTVSCGLVLFGTVAWWLTRRETPARASRALLPRALTQPEAIAALLVLAFLPHAPAALDGANPSLDVVSIARANAGLGGTRVFLDPTRLGAAVILGAWTWMSLRLVLATPASAPQARAGIADTTGNGLRRSAAWLAWLGLVITGVAAGLDASSADLGRILVAQRDTVPFWFAEVMPSALQSVWHTPRWLGITSPWLGLISFATIVAVCTATAHASGHGPGAGHASVSPSPNAGLYGGGRALVDLAAAATLVTFVWGGPTPVSGGTAAAVLATGVVALLAKSLLLVALGRGVMRWLAATRVVA